MCKSIRKIGRRDAFLVWLWKFGGMVKFSGWPATHSRQSDVTKTMSTKSFQVHLQNFELSFCQRMECKGWYEQIEDKQLSNRYVLRVALKDSVWSRCTPRYVTVLWKVMLLPPIFAGSQLAKLKSLKRTNITLQLATRSQQVCESDVIWTNTKA